MLGYVLRIHKETVRAAYGTSFVVIALLVQNKKKVFCTLRERKMVQLVKKRSPNPLGQELRLSFLSEQVSLQHIAPFEMKGNIKRPWRVVMDKEISPSLVNDNTLLNLPLCSQDTLS